MRVLCFFLVLVTHVACRQSPTIRPYRSDVVEAVYASGKILSDSEYTAYALTSGTIVKKWVEDGDFVGKGQVLYEVESDVPETRAAAARSAYLAVQSNLSSRSAVLNELKLAMQSAQARCINDSVHYYRLKALFDQGIGMRSTLDNAHTAYLVSRSVEQAATAKYQATLNELRVSLYQAKSGLAAAQAELRNSYIRSQINGTVYQTLKEAGEAVRPNEAVVLIGSSEKRIIQLAVDQQDILKIKRGQEVLLKTDATGDVVYQAVVDRIYPSMNEADQTFRVDALFAGATNPPFIHTSVEANIIVQKKKKALLIPRTALLSNDSVQLKEQGSIKTVPVQTGIRSPDVVEILSGLNESSELVIPVQK